MAVRASRAALLVILIAAALRVGSTWTVFSQTYDESAHIATGAEWIERGTYYGEPQHPPLARIATAIGPYLAGARLHAVDIGLSELGNEILHAGPYVRMLALARAGILPFFLLSIIVVWAYARMLGGELAGVLAALFFSNLPPVLAHAGLATTDMAVTCGIVTALFFLQRWIAEPTRLQAVFLGLAATVAMTSKFSALLFLAVAGPALVIVLRPRRFAGLWIALLTCVLSVWAVYRFDFGEAERDHLHLLSAWIEQHPGAEFLRPVLDDTAIPMPALFSGVAQMLLHNASGHEAYLLGEFRVDGWWYYFPVAIAVKTPIVFLAIALLSPIIVRRRAGVAPLIAALIILVACMPVKINIGIRHVLPIYPLLAVSAGCAMATLWPRRRAVVVAIVVAEIIVSARAHPDYLAYFNAFAGREPQRILLDSNLDWGQDLLRLEERLRELKVESLRLSYFGSADLTRHDLPPLMPVVHERPAPGWFAVSEAHLASREYGAHFPWLTRYPYERVGRSIRLYHIPGPVPRAERNEILAAMSRIVVPLPLGSSSGSDGRVWKSALRLVNRTDRAQLVLDRLGNRRLIPASGSLVWDAPTERSAFFIYVRKAARIDAEVEVSASRSGQVVETPFTVPAPHASRFRSIAILRTTAACDGCTRTLRIYSLNAGPVAIDVAARAGDRRWSRYMVLSNDPGLPAWTQLDVASLFPELGTTPAEVTVVAYKHEPVWAMMTTSGARREVVTSAP